MPDTRTVDPALIAEIVGAYAAHNTIAAGELPSLITTVHRSLAGLDTPIEIPASKPAVAINRSYNRNFVICLDCGWRGQILRRYLMTSHGLSPDDYRTRWNLKNTHPLTAPGYSERRSTLAKQLGLGHQRQSAEGAAEPAAAPHLASPAEAGLNPAFVASLSQPKRRGRPRSTAPTATTP